MTEKHTIDLTFTEIAAIVAHAVMCRQNVCVDTLVFNYERDDEGEMYLVGVTANVKARKPGELCPEFDPLANAR